MFSTIRKIGIRGIIYKVFSRFFPKDNNIISACDRIGAYRYLGKYHTAITNASFTRNESIIVPSKPKIWMCWLQGFDNAPLIVQKCRDSVLKYNSGCEVVLLDDSNIKNYIDIPDYIVEKHQKGIIHHTQYSDYVRISLLAKHGGIWIDSTAMLTNNLPDYILNADLFCFKLQPLGKVVASSWFIAAKPQNPIVLDVLQLFNVYWKHENRLISYSLIHLCWTMATTANETNRKLWDAVPYMDDVNCKLLQMDLFSPYSESRYNQITSMSSIHKLTYKFDPKYTQKKDTFYEYIIQES